ncbi:hypothetical protein B0H10DRAFT_2031551 [Mycena sp. CBHHK59/15]|nr:hypothetical protein B0H10DRAFT_2031551 [Mycena sp. CBHHK59/15]
MLRARLSCLVWRHSNSIHCLVLLGVSCPRPAAHLRRRTPVVMQTLLFHEGSHCLPLRAPPLIADTSRPERSVQSRVIRSSGRYVIRVHSAAMSASKSGRRTTGSCVDPLVVRPSPSSRISQRPSPCVWTRVRDIYIYGRFGGLVVRIRGARAHSGRNRSAQVRRVVGIGQASGGHASTRSAQDELTGTWQAAACRRHVCAAGLRSGQSRACRGGPRVGGHEMQARESASGGVQWAVRKFGLRETGDVGLEPGGWDESGERGVNARARCVLGCKLPTPR